MSKTLVDSLFEVGAHFGYSKTRRHPSVAPFIFTTKNKTDLINIDNTAEMLEAASNFVKTLSSTGRTIMFVGVKPESREAAEKAGTTLSFPYVTERWLGGTLTNYPEIRKRINRLEDLKTKKSGGELGGFTKKERLMIDREIERLEKFFAGLSTMKKIPDAMFVVDPKREHIAVTEAHKMNIPVIAIAGTDCNIKTIEYPILANDSSISSISFITNEIVEAYKKGIDAKI